MTQLKNETTPDKEKPARLSNGEWMAGGLAAACFACILTAIEGKLTDEHVLRSVRLMATAIPLLLMGIMAMRGLERQGLGWLGRLIPVLGIFAAIIGIAYFIGCFDHIAGALFGVFGVGCAAVLVGANERAMAANARE